MLYFWEDFCNTWHLILQCQKIWEYIPLVRRQSWCKSLLRCNRAWQTQPSGTFVSLLLFGYRPAENVSVRSDPCEILATLIHLCLLPIQCGVNGFLSIGRLAKHIALLHVCTDDRVPLRKKNKTLNLTSESISLFKGCSWISPPELGIMATWNTPKIIILMKKKRFTQSYCGHRALIRWVLKLIPGHSLKESFSSLAKWLKPS